MFTFKNDKERLAFLDDYRNEENGWYIWKDDEDRQETLWRLDIEDGPAIIVEEELRTYSWPNVHRAWTIRHWYIVRDWESDRQTFADQVASRTMALQLLKDMQKKQASAGSEAEV